MSSSKRGNFTRFSSFTGPEEDGSGRKIMKFNSAHHDNSKEVHNVSEVNIEAKLLKQPQKRGNFTRFSSSTGPEVAGSGWK